MREDEPNKPITLQHPLKIQKTIALTQIGIGEGIISNIVSIFFGSVGLAFAISFGLGGRKWAEAIIKKYFYSKELDD